MPLFVSVAIILVLLVILWVAFAREPGPGPADVAIAYETAWDRLDFDMLYDLSGDELRDNMRRDQFIAAKKAAYASTPHDRHLGARVTVDEIAQANESAVVVTRVASDGAEVRNNVLLEKRSSGWLVVGYSIRAS